MMLITIFTPLYNRKKYLQRVFDSILLQDDASIEWLIVDDGSTDHPKELIEQLKKSAPFSIEYHQQPNKGKHVAINNGLNIAKGDYFFILDSDDALPVNALSILRSFINKVHDNPKIAGVSGVLETMNGKKLSDPFFDELVTNSIDVRHKYKVKGDLAEVFKTAVLKKHPFPYFEGEKYCNESLVWNRIAQNYDLLYFNIVIYTCEYLEDGLSYNSVKMRMKSPMAAMTNYAELASYKVPLQIKLKSYINFWRFSFNSKLSLKQKTKLLPLNIGLLFYPFGLILWIRDKQKYIR